MLIEDSHSIDLSVLPDKKGYLTFIIVDAGLTTDLGKRERLLGEKLKTYISYLSDIGFRPAEGFKEDFPNIQRENVCLLLLYKALPPENIKTLSSIQLLPPYESIEVPISIKELNENLLNPAQKKQLAAKRNKKWWQF